MNEDLEKWLIPSEGLLIRDPLTKEILSPTGAYCPWTGPRGRYYRRRVNDGSAVISNPPMSGVSEKKEE